MNALAEVKALERAERARAYGRLSPDPLPSPRLAPRVDPRADSALATGWIRPLVRDSGPELPPMSPGLRNTPILRINQLFAVCLVEGLTSRDSAWVNSPDFLTVCEYAGLNGGAPLLIRQMFNDNTLNLKRLSYWNCGLANEAVA